MSTSHKHQELHAMNAEEPTSTKHSSCEKHQDYLQDLGSHLTFPSQFLAAKNAAMSTLSSYREKFNPSTSYDGLHIYDLEGDE